MNGVYDSFSFRDQYHRSRAYLPPSINSALSCYFVVSSLLLILFLLDFRKKPYSRPKYLGGVKYFLELAFSVFYPPAKLSRHPTFYLVLAPSFAFSTILDTST